MWEVIVCLLWKTDQEERKKWTIKKNILREGKWKVIKINHSSLKHPSGKQITVAIGILIVATTLHQADGHSIEVDIDKDKSHLPSIEVFII